MNRSTLEPIVALIFTVGVFAAPQWYQNEPYAYSSNDDISAAQTYENLDRDTYFTDPANFYNSETHENSEMETSTDWYGTPGGSASYATQGYEGQENSEIAPSYGWSETPDGSESYDAQGYQQLQENSEWPNTSDGSESYDTQDYQGHEDSEVEPSPDLSDTQGGSQSYYSESYRPEEDSEMEPSPDYPDTPNGSESSDLEENEPQDDFDNSSHSMGDVDNQENTIEESFCGFEPEGHDEEFRERGHKFKNKNVRYKISQYSEVISDNDVDEIIDYAFGAWTQVVDLEFNKVDYMDDADIDIRFAAYDHGCASAFDGPGKVLAHATMNYVHFDDSESWSREVDGISANLYAVAVHEIGHSLGLSHSDDYEAMMYATYFRTNPTMELGADDIAGIQKIYGRKRAPIRPTDRAIPMEPPMEPMEPPMQPMEPPMEPMEPPMEPMEPPMSPLSNCCFCHWPSIFG